MQANGPNLGITEITEPAKALDTSYLANLADPAKDTEIPNAAC